MEMDKTRRVQITSVIIMVLLVICLFLLVSGWLFRIEEALLSAASPLACPVNAKLITRNIEVLSPGQSETERKFAFHFECVGLDGTIVQNHADLILGSICISPFFLSVLWAFAPRVWVIVSTIFRPKGKRPIRVRKE